MIRILTFTAALAAAFLVAGCGGGGDTAQTAENATPPAETQNQAEPEAKPAETAKEPAASANPLMDPKSAEMNAEAPATFKVKFETSKGDVVVQVTREWSPNGADRVYNLVRAGYYDDVRFFRVLTGFMAQFGMHGDPKINTVWQNATIPDDPVIKSNTRGMLTFAKRGTPNSRSTQLFINYGNNASLDAQGFAPLGEVVEGMDIVDSFYAAYGEGAPRGQGPSQGTLGARGNAYLASDFPKLDHIKKASIVE